MKLRLFALIFFSLSAISYFFIEMGTIEGNIIYKIDNLGEAKEQMRKGYFFTLCAAIYLISMGPILFLAYLEPDRYPNSWFLLKSKSIGAENLSVIKMEFKMILLDMGCFLNILYILYTYILSAINHFDSTTLMNITLVITLMAIGGLIFMFDVFKMILTLKKIQRKVLR